MVLFRSLQQDTTLPAKALSFRTRDRLTPTGSEIKKEIVAISYSLIASIFAHYQITIPLTTLNTSDTRASAPHLLRAAASWIACAER